jgi:hypothetical protein
MDIIAIKRKILVTAPPTDILHRATLINSAMTPLYNHILMALPATGDDLQSLYMKFYLSSRPEQKTWQPYKNDGL